MSSLIADPTVLESAGVSLAGLGATVDDSHSLAAPALAVIPAAGDDVSAAIAHAFAGFGRDYQAMARQAAAFHEAFSKNLAANSTAYAATESFLQNALNGLRGDITYWAKHDPLQLLVWLLALPPLLLLSPILLPLYLLLGVFIPANAG